MSEKAWGKLVGEDLSKSCQKILEKNVTKRTRRGLVRKNLGKT